MPSVFEEGQSRDLATNAQNVNVVGGNVSLSAADIEIGAVELKDGVTDTRVGVDGTYGVAADVKRAPGQSGEAGVLPPVLYVVGGYSGSEVRSLKTDSSGVLKVDVAGADITVPSKITDAGGTNVAQILSAAAAGTEKGLAVHVVTQPAGAGGTPLAQTQVRNASNVWTDVGYSAGNQKMPVDGSGVTQPVSAASLPLPAGAATDATLTGGTSKAIVRGGAKGATATADVTSTAEGADHQALDAQLYHGGVAIDPRAVTGPLTDTQLRASAVPVSGPLTDTQLRASAVPVTIPTPTPVTDNSGSLTVDAPVATPVAIRLSDGTSFIATLPVSGPLTDAQIRASALPVSGP